MNSIERINATINFRKPDRVPVDLHNFQPAAAATGMPLDVVFQDGELLAEMANKNIALLRADWTRRDPEVTRALADLGRNGVPVYAIYKSGQAPQILSEILAVEEVRKAIAGF